MGKVVFFLFFIFFILIEMVVTWYNLSEAINLKCVNSVVCKLELSKVDFKKQIPGAVSHTSLRHVCGGLFLADEISGALLSCWFAGSPEHGTLTMPSPPSMPGSSDLISSVQCLVAQKRYLWSQGSWFLFCLYHFWAVQSQNKPWPIKYCITVCHIRWDGCC